MTRLNNSVDAPSQITVQGGGKLPRGFNSSYTYLFNFLGAVFASIAFFQNICSMVGTVAGAAIYSASVNFYSGFAFIVMTGLNVVAFILLS